MALNPRKIKNKTVTVDRDIGEAVVTITLHGRQLSEKRTRIRTSDAKLIAIEGGAEVVGVISGNTITNRDGENTGIWIFKIPAYKPENTTTAILKRRAKVKTKEEKVVIEEDWNLGPEE